MAHTLPFMQAPWGRRPGILARTVPGDDLQSNVVATRRRERVHCVLALMFTHAGFDAARVLLNVEQAENGLNLVLHACHLDF